MPSATTTYETVLVDRTDAIGTITLNRPKVLNALNAQLLEELESAQPYSFNQCRRKLR